MSSSSRDYTIGVSAVLFSSVVWGTTGTAATFAPEVSAVAIGAAAMGIGGLLQALLAGRGIVRSLSLLNKQWALLVLGGLAVAIYPLAFYASMRMAGVYNRNGRHHRLRTAAFCSHRISVRRCATLAPMAAWRIDWTCRDCLDYGRRRCRPYSYRNK